MQKLASLSFAICLCTVVSHQVRADQSAHLAYLEPPAISHQPILVRSATSLGAVLFRSDSTAIEQALWPVLDGALALAREHPDATIKLEGYTDVRGSRNHNRTLSVNRIKSVRDFFVRNGIAPNRIEAVAYGESRASTNVKDTSGHIFDRRVTITLQPSSLDPIGKS